MSGEKDKIVLRRNVMDHSNIKFYYPHVEMCNEWGDVVKRYRIAISYMHLDDDQIEVSFSFCSPRDRFLRKEGREISKNRLLSHDSVILHAQKRNFIETINKFIELSHVLDHVPSGFPMKQMRKSYDVCVDK